VKQVIRQTGDGKRREGSLQKEEASQLLCALFSDHASPSSGSGTYRPPHLGAGLIPADALQGLPFSHAKAASILQHSNGPSMWRSLKNRTIGID